MAVHSIGMTLNDADVAWHCRASSQRQRSDRLFEVLDLTQTDASLTKQYQALLKTEEVELQFAPDGIRRLAEIAFSVNEKVENIGARRLYTVMERLLEDVSFHAARRTGETVAIGAAFVDQKLAGIAGDDNLSRYIL